MRSQHGPQPVRCEISSELGDSGTSSPQSPQSWAYFLPPATSSGFWVTSPRIVVADGPLLPPPASALLQQAHRTSDVDLELALVV